MCYQIGDTPEIGLSFVDVAVIYGVGAFALSLADAVVTLVCGRQLHHRFWYWCGYDDWLVADFWTYALSFISV
ncbi:hypothetical protein C2G38_2222601 [Gigaspora rosea]|uniref:Uncharacterized protein n=1 Tax=Gigaspora rosea TaxID=44941 RepID=A0A397UB38_9GLOM|nr:hypothetical protein C2G38_2222601 [Gigaspora rosea]